MKDEKKENDNTNLQRRSLLKTTAAATLGLGALTAATDNKALAEEIHPSPAPLPEVVPQVARPTVRESVKITKLETILVRPRWLFLKIHTNVGVVGLGEPIVEGRALTCQAAIKELEPYLIGKDPRAVVHHWQAIYRHAFYRGGPVLTSALSGVDQALWDIKGKLLGVPVYELLGGPTRQRIRVYAQAGTPEAIRDRKAQGFTAFKIVPGRINGRQSRAIENRAWIEALVAQFARLREAVGKDGDLAIDFHGAIPPATAKILIKELEQFHPFFYEEIINCQNVDLMAELAKTTHVPIATGERVYTKWGFREILEKGAATILQPDLCHAGGITEVRLIAGMAEARAIDQARLATTLSSLRRWFEFRGSQDSFFAAATTTDLRRTADRRLSISIDVAARGFHRQHDDGKHRESPQSCRWSAADHRSSGRCRNRRDPFR